MAVTDVGGLEYDSRVAEDKATLDDGGGSGVDRVANKVHDATTILAACDPGASDTGSRGEGDELHAVDVANVPAMEDASGQQPDHELHSGSMGAK